MAAIIQASSFMCTKTSTSSPSSSSHRLITRASIHLPKISTANLDIFTPNIASNISMVQEMHKFSRITPKNPTSNPNVHPDHEVIMEKLYMILEAVSDRVEMHKNIGEQRNNWNSLLLTSINTILLIHCPSQSLTELGGCERWSGCELGDSGSSF
ncbi:putative petal formation-expressed [Helianthus annuus]|nr:putative petal formation-expressed [Helianthus annuus]KAJ0647659.1 putative petal formation-expressed [Helianthus annuus]